MNRNTLRKIHAAAGAGAFFIHRLVLEQHRVQ